MVGSFAPYEVAHSQPSLDAMCEALDDDSLTQFLTGSYRHFFTDSPKRYTEDARKWAAAWAYGYKHNGDVLDAVAADMYDFAESLDSNYMQMGALAAEAGRRDQTSAAGAVLSLYRPFEEYFYDVSLSVPRVPWLVQTSEQMTEFCSVILEAAGPHALDRRDTAVTGALMESASVYDYASRILSLSWADERARVYAELFSGWTGSEDPLFLIRAYQSGMTLEDLRSFIDGKVSTEYALPVYGLTV